MDKKYTIKDLQEMQSWPLDRKILVTQLRIIEFAKKFDNNIYVSFSGGKDSTVLLDIARKIDNNIPAVFIDTGLEYPEVRTFVKSFDNVTIIKPEMNFREVIEKYGYPLINKEVSQKIYDARKKPDGAVAARFDKNSEHNKKYNNRYSMANWNWLKDTDIPISDRCCKVMKKKPAKKYEKETGRKPIVGTMACESSLRTSAWLKHGCNMFDSKRPISQPMSFWTEQDVLHYIKQYEVPYVSVYGKIESYGDFLYTTGVERTGCIYCLYGSHLEWEPTRLQKLHTSHPELYDYCMRKTVKKKDDEGNDVIYYGLNMKEMIDNFNSKAPKKIHIHY